MISIIGARCEDLLLFRDELCSFCPEVLISTNDGSCGHQGLVTDLLVERLTQDKTVAEVVAIGPVPMAKKHSKGAVDAISAEYAKAVQLVNERHWNDAIAALTNVIDNPATPKDMSCPPAPTSSSRKAGCDCFPGTPPHPIGPSTVF